MNPQQQLECMHTSPPTVFKPLYILKYQQSQKLLKPLVLFRNTSLPALLMVLSLVFLSLSSPMELAFASKLRLKCC